MSKRSILVFVDLDLKTVRKCNFQNVLEYGVALKKNYLLIILILSIFYKHCQQDLLKWVSGCNPPLKTSSVHYPSTLSEGKKTEAESPLQRPSPDPLYLQIDFI